MSVVIVCCGCGGMLLSDGSLYRNVGILDLNRVALDSIPVDKLASFSDRNAADKHVRSVGWSAINGNHRCPECRIKESTLEQSRQGMYIDLAEFS